MFENLIESNRKTQNSLGQQAVSFMVHGLLIVGAIKATQGAAEVVRDIVVDTTMVFLKPPEPPPPPPPEQVPQNVVVTANPPPQGFQIVTPPDNIPTEIPPVNLNERFDPRDFTGKGVEGGIATGVVGGTGPVPIEGEVFLAAEVDETPAVEAGSVCLGKYPPVMQSAGIPGKVVLQFVVNTDGKVDPSSIKVVSSTHKAFEEPAKAGITGSSCHFRAGKSRGQPVRVLVQQAVSFKVGQ